MSILAALEMEDTDKSRLLKDNEQTFKDLFTLMEQNKLDRLFFLSSLGNLYRNEAIDIDDLILKSLIESKLESQKAEKAQKKISKNISEKISERRAVSFRAGNFGLIIPFDKNKMELQKVKPSINHIYGSYFFNTFALFGSMKRMYSSMTYSTIRNMFHRFDGKVGKFIEEFYICEECGSFSERELTCDHEKITLKLLKLNPQVHYAWDNGALFPGYIAHILSTHGWDAIAEKKVKGNCMHQIDVIAEKDNKIVIFECKHYEAGYKVPKNELMKSFGVMDDLERFIRHIDNDVNIKKVYATTSDYHRDTNGLDIREDIVLLNSKDIFASPGRWVCKIE